MIHIKTVLCSNSMGIDNLERHKLLQGDPLVKKFGVLVKEPKNVFRLLSNINNIRTQMFRGIKFQSLQSATL